MQVDPKVDETEDGLDEDPEAIEVAGDVLAPQRIDKTLILKPADWRTFPPLYRPP